MYKIVFSVPVHESPESIIDQIINYSEFNRDCAVILHISGMFSYKNSRYTKETFEEELKRFPNVYINPNHLRTGYADIIQAHISNFHYAESIIDFEYFSIGASNDLFVKKGLYDLMKNYDAGYNRKHTIKNVDWVWHEACFHDRPLEEMVRRYGGDMSSVLICQIEGCFYKKWIFERIADIIQEHYNFKEYDFRNRDKKKTFPREEVYFSTLTELVFPEAEVLYANYAFVAFDIRVSHIPKLSDIKKYSEDGSNIFNVKRINRTLNDPFRAYIRDNIGKYYRKEKEIVEDVKRCNYLHLYLWNTGIFLNNCRLANTLRHIVRKLLGF